MEKTKATTTTSEDSITSTTFLIIGGGIAGVSCLETLRFLCPSEPVTIVTESALIKRVTNLVPLGKCLHRFDVRQQSASSLAQDDPIVRIITGDRLAEFHSASRLALTANGLRIRYRFMCLCTGARPQMLPQSNVAPDRVLGIRDTDSVATLQQRIRDARRLLIVGNGGIAAECAYAVRNVHVDWAIRDAYVAQTFVDPGAATFFRDRVEGREKRLQQEEERVAPIKRMVYGETSGGGEGSGSREVGAALGPDWHRQWDFSGDDRSGSSSVTVHSQCEVVAIEDNEQQPGETTSPASPLLVRLSNGCQLATDLVISATGVAPTINFTCTDAELRLSVSDGGICVDELQRTSVPRVWAAGDCATADWQPLAEHWLQMRLWTQARQMGAMAARAMAGECSDPGVEVLQDFCFELFGHVTQLFGYAVVLLGKFNGQGLGGDYEVLIRSTPGVEYVKYVLQGGRVKGAILIGETGLEETTENLILNGLDVSGFGEGLLDPDVDIEDYFD